MSDLQKRKNAILVLFVILIVFIIAFIVFGVLALKNRNPIDTTSIEEILETDTVIEGVTIEGIDVSLMDESQVRAALLPTTQKWHDEKDIYFAVDRNTFVYNVREFGVKPDINRVIKEVFLYSAAGQLPEGVFVETDGSVNFTIKPDVLLNKVSALLMSEKVASQINIAPDDAGIIFRSQTPDEDERFEYQEPVPGVKVDIEKFAQVIVEAIEEDDYSVIETPTKPVSSFTSIDDMKENTKLVGSYTSPITINIANRTKNIKRLAQLLCEGMPVIQPGETLSLNGVAGMRTAENGFFEAPGLTSGVHDLQYGGGVCQISSTVYIAALEAELQIDERTHHSLPSDYITIGLDATISEKPDLKITNNKTYPIYMSIVVDDQNMQVTVSFYGKPAAHGYNVELISKVVKSSFPAAKEYKYSATTPGGSDIKSGQLYEYIEHTYGRRVKVYRQYSDNEGNVIKSEYLYDDRYDAFSGVYYLNPNEKN